MEKRIYLFLRYLIIISIIVGVSVSVSDKFGTAFVILILIFIINNQTRYFTYRDNERFVFLSIIIEWIIGYILYKNHGGILITYFIIGIIDTFFLIDEYVLRIISATLGIGMFVYSARIISTEEFFSQGISLITIAFISSIIQLQYDKKEKIEELYDILKLSERILIDRNIELKEYSKSLKDLTLLKERNRISREIHDSVGHSLSTIIIQLGAIEKISKVDGEKASIMTANLREFSKKGLEEIRGVLQELKPKDFSEYEVILEIENLVKEFMDFTDVDVNITYSKSKYPLREEVSLVLYRAVQEFLSNSIKHGGSTKINIFLNFESDELIVSMKDNGVGTDKIQIGMGLMSLSERVKEAHGSVSFESQKAKGFAVRIVFKGGEYKGD